MFKIRTNECIICVFEHVEFFYEFKETKVVLYTGNYCKIGDLQIPENASLGDVQKIVERRLARMTSSLLATDRYDLWSALKVDQRSIEEA